MQADRATVFPSRVLSGQHLVPKSHWKSIDNRVEVALLQTDCCIPSSRNDRRRYVRQKGLVKQLMMCIRSSSSCRGYQSRSQSVPPLPDSRMADCFHVPTCLSVSCESLRGLLCDPPSTLAYLHLPVDVKTKCVFLKERERERERE